MPFGGNNYTDAIAQRLGIPVDQAEAAKRGHDVGVNWDDLVPALEAVSRELSLEVQRTFDYFASTAESERIGKIVLSGGCAKLAGIESFLASSWGVPVELARPLAARDRDEQQMNDEELRSADCLLAVAVGLGLRRPGDKDGMIRINLAPPSTKKARPSLASPSGRFNLGLVFGVVFVALIGLLGGYWWKVSSEIARLNGEIDQAEAREDPPRGGHRRGAALQAREGGAREPRERDRASSPATRRGRST